MLKSWGLYPLVQNKAYEFNSKKSLKKILKKKQRVYCLWQW